jgi:hypothetical protein
MTEQRDHNKVIVEAARDVLQALGLRRKGRSRTWLDDHGWWLGVVEFQPSSWARGSYLNVGAMWLWRNTPAHHIYFGLGHRIDGAGFADASDAAFDDAVAAMAEAASARVRAIRAQLPTLEAAAAVLSEQARRERGWPQWDAAVALGLCGKSFESSSFFRAVARDDDDREWWLPVKQTPPNSPSWYATILRSSMRVWTGGSSATGRRSTFPVPSSRAGSARPTQRESR